MNDARLNAIADEMRTLEFVGRICAAKANMLAAVGDGRPYTEKHLARDLAVPRPVARLLISFITATEAEKSVSAVFGGFPQPEGRT